MFNGSGEAATSALLIVVFGLLAACASAPHPLLTPTTALVTASSGAEPAAAEPPPLRIQESEFIANKINALVLSPGPHRVTVDYEDSPKRKVEGFQSRETYTPPLVDAAPHSRCTIEFAFEAGRHYQVVRSSISNDGTLRLLWTDGWGVWLIEAGGDRPLAKCF